MSSLDFTSVLEVAVFGLAVVQALTILLTVRREGDVKELRELVDEQRLRLAELRAWLAGRNASQRRIASERETNHEPIAEVKALESGMPPRDLEWQREIAARLQSGIRGQVPLTEHAIKPAPAADFKWFKDDPNPRRDIAGADAGSGKTYLPGANDQDLLENEKIRSNTELDEVEKTLKAIRLLKED